MFDDILLKDKTSEIESEKISDNPSVSSEEYTETDKRVLCRKCHGFVADIKDSIKINDSDYHLFSNPSGIYFRVICFSRASGVIAVTEYTAEHTWFPEYLWSIALCRSCGTHLGWHYKSENSVFYGLIADRLTGI